MTLRITCMLSQWENVKSAYVQYIYFILAQLGYKWLAPGKTFPMISHFTSYLTYLLIYDTQNHPHLTPIGNYQVRLCPKYIFLAQLGYKWLGTDKTSPMIYHLTSYDATCCYDIFHTPKLI